MHIILRFICGIFSRISFLLGCKHCVYEAASFAASLTSWYLPNGKQTFTFVILYINIICITKWIFGASFQILHYSSAFALRQKHFKPWNFFKQTHVDFFTTKIWRHFSITSQLCLGPFLCDLAQTFTNTCTSVQ